jgi:N-acetylneuraminate synthase
MNKQVFPDIIAEVSGNHNGSLERALDIVEAAAEAGATAIKLQTYTASTITLDSDGPAFVIGQEHPLWGGRKLFDLYQEAHTPWEWHEPIFARATELGLDFFSTPFDETAVDFLESLGVSRYKIASIEIVDLPLIKKAAETGKPIILSTGASTLDEVAAAVGAVRSVSDSPITLLVCSSSYPATPESSNLASMETLRKEFSVDVGFSDHTPGSASAVAASVLGASLIEKHLTLDNDGGGPDDKFSANPETFRHMVSDIRIAVRSLGRQELFVAPEEEQSRLLRPSLWITKDVSAGDTVSLDNVASLRPSGGLAPSHLPDILGKKFAEDLSRGTAVLLEHLT